MFQQALILPHSKVQAHEVPRCTGCLHCTEHEAVRVAPCSSLDSSSLRSKALMIATSPTVTAEPGHYVASIP